MIKLTLREIANAVDGKILSGKEDIEINSVSIDSRNMLHNGLFIPLKGDKVDGHDYITKAFENNAAAVLTQYNTHPYQDKGIVLVKDTKAALGQIAKYYKKKFKVKTVAVTGSVGKTTTKEFLSSFFISSSTSAPLTKVFKSPLSFAKIIEKEVKRMFCGIISFTSLNA